MDHLQRRVPLHRFNYLFLDLSWKLDLRNATLLTQRGHLLVEALRALAEDVGLVRLPLDALFLFLVVRSWSEHHCVVGLFAGEVVDERILHGFSLPIVPLTRLHTIVHLSFPLHVDLMSTVTSCLLLRQNRQVDGGSLRSRPTTLFVRKLAVKVELLGQV